MRNLKTFGREGVSPRLTATSGALARTGVRADFELADYTVNLGHGTNNGINNSGTLHEVRFADGAVSDYIAAPDQYSLWRIVIDKKQSGFYGSRSPIVEFGPHTHVPGYNFEGFTITGFAPEHAEGTNFKNASLRIHGHMDAAGADFRNAVVNGPIAGSGLSKTRLQGARFSGDDHHTDIHEANASGAVFNGNWSSVNAQHLHGYRVSFNGAFAGTDFRGTDVTHLALQGNGYGAHFSGAAVHIITYGQTDLQHAKGENAAIHIAGHNPARMDESSFHGALSLTQGGGYDEAEKNRAAQIRRKSAPIKIGPYQAFTVLPFEHYGTEGEAELADATPTPQAHAAAPAKPFIYSSMADALEQRAGPDTHTDDQAAIKKKHPPVTPPSQATLAHMAVHEKHGQTPERPADLATRYQYWAGFDPRLEAA